MNIHAEAVIENWLVIFMFRYFSIIYCNIRIIMFMRYSHFPHEVNEKTQTDTNGALM